MSRVVAPAPDVRSWWGPDPWACIWLLLPPPRQAPCSELPGGVQTPPGGVNYLMRSTPPYAVFTPSLRRFLLASEPTMGYAEGPLAPHRQPRFLLRANSKGDPLLPATPMELPCWDRCPLP